MPFDVKSFTKLKEHTKYISKPSGGTGLEELYIDESCFFSSVKNFGRFYSFFASLSL